MFEILLESRHVRPPRPVAATVFSAILHAGIVALAIGGTTAVVANEEMNAIWETMARFLAPPERAAGASGEQVSFLGQQADGSLRGEPNGAPEKVNEKATSGNPVIPQQIAPAVRLGDLERLQVAAAAVGAYILIEVDSVAERDPLSAAPSYPREMLERNIEGSAIMQFVVDSTGLIDMGTITVVRATHQEFVRAVRDAMPRMRFRPAMRGSAAVRQLVEQPFKFEIKLPVAAASNPVKKP